jgi:hypothetical protein
MAMKHKETNKELLAHMPIAVAYTSQSWGIRKTASVRWICDTFEHSFDADNKLISSKIVKSSEQMSWSFILETWRNWSAAAIGKLK